MSTITLPNIRVSSDLTIRLKLKDGGVAIDWSTLQNIRVSLYADDQRSMASRCNVSIDEEDSTILVCQYAANKMQYLGVNRVIVQCKYMGEVKTYDKPAFTFVRWTSDQEGEQITIDDPDVDVEITVEDVSSSILQEAVDAAFDAADRANDAAAAAEHMVDIHTGPEGKSAYEVAVEEGYTGTEEEWLASLKGPVGETPDISIGTVTTVEPGTPAAASMGGTPEAPVLNLSIPKGLVGATPNFTVGTVTTGEPGSSVIVTITGTPEAPVLNLTIPQGMQGNTGSSVDYPYELVNNLTTNDATKGLSAAQGVVLAGQVSQLEHKVDDLSTGKYYGYFAQEEDLPEADVDGFAYVGEGPTYTIYNCVGGVWTSSEITVNQSPIGNEEDIDQNEDGKLQFANRTYNAQQPNGMGYKILRKDATFTSQVTDTNTIYEIRYPFNLNSASVSIPSGCVLQFNGGKISNGTLASLGNCNIIASDNQIFDNVSLSGDWGGEARADWFADLQKAVDAYPVVALSPRKTYTLSTTLAMYAGSQIIGNGALIVSSSATCAVKFGSGSKIENCIIQIADGVTNSIGILIDLDYTYQTKQDNRFGVYGGNFVPQKFILENVTLSNGIPSGYHSTAIKLVGDTKSGMWGNVAKDFFIYGKWEYGIYIDSQTGTSSSATAWFTNLLFEGGMMADCQIGVYITKTNTASSTVAPNGITFKDIRFQSLSTSVRNTIESGGGVARFAYLEKCKYVVFRDCFITDWANNKGTAVLSSAPFLINPNTAQNIVIDHCLVNGVDKVFDRSVAMAAAEYQNPMVDITGDFFEHNLTNWVDLTLTSASFNVQVLPKGKYLVASGDMSNFITKMGCSSLLATAAALVEIIPTASATRTIKVTALGVASNGEKQIAYCSFTSRKTENNPASMSWAYL